MDDLPMRRAKTDGHNIGNIALGIQTPCRHGHEGVARVQIGDLGSPGLYMTGTTQKTCHMPSMDSFRWNAADNLRAADHLQEVCAFEVVLNTTEVVIVTTDELLSTEGY
jgi:hypothetical protein